MFKIFPEFHKLTIGDREVYESLMQDYPAISDLSFTTLMLWWSLDKQVEISLLNNNVVLHYYLPGDEKNSGYTLIGTERVAQSLQDLFAYLQDNNLPVRVVHVPEFVKDALQGVSELSVHSEPDYDEYILDTRTFSAMAGSDLSRVRRKIGQFRREAGEGITFEKIDLAEPSNQEMVLEVLRSFDNGGRSANDPDGQELVVLEKAVRNARDLYMCALVMRVRGQAHGLALYHLTFDDKYSIVNHVKVRNEYPHAFDVVLHQLALQSLDMGIEFMNIEMDLGVPGLRFHKQGLRPAAFHRKFTIEPAAAMVAK